MDIPKTEEQWRVVLTPRTHQPDYATLTLAVDRKTLDLRGVTFFDSAAIHALLQLAEVYGERLRVLPSTQVRRVLEISGLAAQPWLVIER